MRTRHIPLLVTVLTPLAGCVNLERPYPAKELFGISVPETPRAATTHDGALRVERVRVAAPYNERPMIYRTGLSSFQSDYYHEFVADPGALITGETVRILAASGIFRSVLEPGSVADAAYRLDSTITDFCADLRDPGAPKAVVRARFLLLQDRLDATTVVGEWTIGAEEPAANTDASSIAQALGRALAGVESKLIDALSRAELPAPGAR